jgi:SAM-dependent methyltransferase
VRLAGVLRVLTPVLDIVAGPVDDPAVPSWCNERGWSDFLLGLGDDELAAWESQGLDSERLEHARVPASFRELFREVRRLTELPRLDVRSFPLPPALFRGVSARKREQLGTLVEVLRPFARRAERVVDVGAGSGHFSRLSAELFGRETLALDRNALRLERGSALHRQRSRTTGALDVQFVQADLSRQELPLRRTDLAVGLHACGGLGDRLVVAAARARCDVALISCCLQKIDGPRRYALSGAAGDFSVGKSELGLTNLTIRAEGVEATVAENLRGREVRLALRQLLRARGVELRAGEEMRGINRRRAHAGLEELASRGFALRGLTPPTAKELRFHAEKARRDHASIRRLSLPRHFLARLVELAIVLDRAAKLEESGLDAQVVELYERRVTPRNTLLLASASPER